MAFREAGSAFVRLFVKKDELSAGLKQAETEVKATTENIQAAAEKSSIGFRGVGLAIKDWARPLKTFQTAITSTIGIVSGLLGTVGLIAATITTITAAVVALIPQLSNSRKEAEAFKENLKTALGIAEQIRKSKLNPDIEDEEKGIAALRERIRIRKRGIEEFQSLIRSGDTAKIIGQQFDGLMRPSQENIDIMTRRLERDQRRIARIDEAVSNKRKEAAEKESAAIEAEAKARQDEVDRLAAFKAAKDKAVQDRQDALQKEIDERAAMFQKEGQQRIDDLGDYFDKLSQGMDEADAKAKQNLKERLKAESDARVALEKQLNDIAAARLRQYQSVIDALSGTNTTADQRAQTGLLQIIANKVGRGSY